MYNCSKETESIDSNRKRLQKQMCAGKWRTKTGAHVSRFTVHVRVSDSTLSIGLGVAVAGGHRNGR